MLSTAAFNALLKTLEEPPGHAIFILATTEVHKIPATVLSRCQRHEFRRIPVDVMMSALDEIVEQEVMQLEEGVVELIARQATGSLRDAISLLDLLSSTGDVVSLDQARKVLGTAAGEAVVELIRALIERQASDGLMIIHRAIDAGTDARQMARQLVAYLRALLLIQVGNQELIARSVGLTSDMSDLAKRMDRATLMRGIEAFGEAALRSDVDWQPGLGLEMAFMETIVGQPQPEPKPDGGGNPGPSTADDAPGHDRGSADPRGKPPAPDTPKAEHRGASAGPVSFQTVLDRWAQILSTARTVDPQAQALLNSSKPLGLRGGDLVLGFASDILREKMEGGQNRAKVAQVVEQVLGHRLGIRCTLTESWDPDDSLRSRPSVPDGGMVATAMRDLGAQLAEVQPVDQGDRAGGRGPRTADPQAGDD